MKRERGVAMAAHYLEAMRGVTAKDFLPSAMPLTKLQSMKGSCFNGRLVGLSSGAEARARASLGDGLPSRSF